MPFGHKVGSSPAPNIAVDRASHAQTWAEIPATYIRVRITRFCLFDALQLFGIWHFIILQTHQLVDAREKPFLTRLNALDSALFAEPALWERPLSWSTEEEQALKRLSRDGQHQIQSGKLVAHRDVSVQDALVHLVIAVVVL